MDLESEQAEDEVCTRENRRFRSRLRSSLVYLDVMILCQLATLFLRDPVVINVSQLTDHPLLFPGFPLALR